MKKNKDIPKKIYLQYFDPDEPTEKLLEPSFSEERIFSNDLIYILKQKR